MLRKKTVVFVVLFIILFSIFPVQSYAVSAQSAILILADTNEVLYSKNAEKKMSMASTTKIMTALLACESGRLDDEVTITDNMVRVEGTSMGLRAGDRLTLKNIVKGMMLLSGNDAANAIAVFLSGGLENFASEMNSRANRIGLKNTHFVTPSGLDDKEHYSTAYDMALLASEAMKNPLFKSFVCDYNGSVEYIKPEAVYHYRNHNRFLTMYDGACGIKTGFTKKSGRCLVTAVERSGSLFIAVTLNAPDDWNDHISLYNLCLNNFSKKTVDDLFNCKVCVIGGRKNSVNGLLSKKPEILTDKKRIRTELLTEKFIYAPIKEGDKIGTLRVYLADNYYKDYPIISTEAIELSVTDTSKKGIIYKIKEQVRRFERWLTTA